MTDAKVPNRLWRRGLLVVGVLLVLAVAVWMLVDKFSSTGQTTKKRVIQEIALLKPPPPPPPPKTPPPPQPKEIQQKIETPQPDQQPDKPANAPPPGPDLAVDAAGSGAGDGFGLVGKKGGADLIGSGVSTGSRFAWYGALVKDRLQEAILKEKRLRDANDYQRLVNVWLGAAGNVTRVELVGAVDSAELDAALRAALRNVLPVREGPPSDMPQPIRLRITAR